MTLRGAHVSVPVKPAAAAEAVLRPALAALSKANSSLSQEILAVSKENDPQLLLEDYLALAQRLATEGQMESALSLYSALWESS